MNPVKTKFKRLANPQVLKNTLVIKTIGGPQKLNIDMALVADILGLVKMQTGNDRLRGVMAVIGALRVMHEQSDNLDIERTADEIKKAFMMCEIEKGQVQ